MDMPLLLNWIRDHNNLDLSEHQSTQAVQWLLGVAHTISSASALAGQQEPPLALLHSKGKQLDFSQMSISYGRRQSALPQEAELHNAKRSWS
jgi:hypothetical protein